jgi:hypothetical protein
VRGHERPREALGGTQRHLASLGDPPGPSGAIRGTPRHSGALRSTHRHSRGHQQTCNFACFSSSATGYALLSFWRISVVSCGDGRCDDHLHAGPRPQVDADVRTLVPASSTMTMWSVPPSASSSQSSRSPSNVMSTGRAPNAQHWSMRPHWDGVVISPWYARSISPRTVSLRS